MNVSGQLLYGQPPATTDATLSMMATVVAPVGVTSWAAGDVTTQSRQIWSADRYLTYLLS